MQKQTKNLVKLTCRRSKKKTENTRQNSDETSNKLWKN